MIVVPLERAAGVVEREKAKLTGENHTRDALLKGKLLGEVYKEYGIL